MAKIATNSSFSYSALNNLCWIEINNFNGNTEMSKKQQLQQIIWWNFNDFLLPDFGLIFSSLIFLCVDSLHLIDILLLFAILQKTFGDWNHFNQIHTDWNSILPSAPFHPVQSIKTHADWFDFIMQDTVAIYSSLIQLRIAWLAAFYNWQLDLLCNLSFEQWQASNVKWLLNIDKNVAKDRSVLVGINHPFHLHLKNFVII